MNMYVIGVSADIPQLNRCFGILNTGILDATRSILFWQEDVEVVGETVIESVRRYLAGEREWETEQGRPILEIARREGVMIAA